MRVAWLTHHDLNAREGGAEATDRELIHVAPSHVEVIAKHPNDVDDLAEFDRVVVSRMENMGETSARIVERHRPVILVHGDVLPKTASLRRLMQRARVVVTQSELSLRVQEEWCGPLPNAVCEVPYMDVEGIKDGPKEEFALWPHRLVAHKGLPRAKAWANESGLRLEVMCGQPRKQVLERMSIARYVVLFSEIVDGCPRAIREAQLSGCQIVVNDLVGWWPDLTKEQLMYQTLAAAGRFWKGHVRA